MRHDIKEFRPRQPLDRQLGSNVLNNILKELESLRIVKVNGGSFKKLPSGTEIILGNNQTRANKSTTRPFEIQCSPSSDNENQFVVTVQPGTINNVLASNTFANGIDLTPFTIPADSLQYVSLLFKSNDGSIGESALSVDDKIPELQKSLPNSLPSAASVLLGVVYNGTIKQIVTDNLRAYGTVLYTTNKESGQTNNWYIWTWEHA